MDERPGAMEPGPALEVIAWKGHSKARRHRNAAGAGLGAGRGAVERTGEEGIGKKTQQKERAPGSPGQEGGQSSSRQSSGQAGGRGSISSSSWRTESRTASEKKKNNKTQPTSRAELQMEKETALLSPQMRKDGRTPPLPPTPPFFTPRFAAARCGSHGPGRAPSGPGAVPLRTAPPRRTASVALTPRAAPVAAGLPAARHRLALGTVVGGSPPPRDTGCCLLKVGRGGSFPTLRRRDAGKDGAAAAAREGLVAGAALMASGISQHGTQPGAVTGKAQRWWGRAVLPDGLGILCHPREHTVPAPNQKGPWQKHEWLIWRLHVEWAAWPIRVRLSKERTLEQGRLGKSLYPISAPVPGHTQTSLVCPLSWQA